MFTSLLVAFLCIAPSFAQRETVLLTVAPIKFQPEQVVSTIRSEFGPTVEPVTDMKPFYWQGDFNGDGVQDLAVVVSIEKAQTDLQKHGVKYVNVDPYSKDNGGQSEPTAVEPHNCLGIAVTHGGLVGMGAPAQKYIMYECFSAVKLIGKGEGIKRGAGSRGQKRLKPKGDSLLLELENGGAALIYWDGRTYKGVGMKRGD